MSVSVSLHRRALLASGVFLLAACAGTPAPPKEVPPRPPREQLNRFSLFARASIRHAGEANIATISWEHSTQSDMMDIGGPAGIQVARLQRTAQGAVWETRDGEHFEARSADELFAQLTNEPVPVEALSRWVTGRLGRTGAVAQRDAFGRLTEGEELGWAVRVVSYEVERADALPSVIEVERGTLKIRLAIQEWDLS